MSTASKMKPSSTSRTRKAVYHHIQPTDELKFCASYVTSGLFTDAEVIAFIEMAERLLKRSDNNIETLIQLLEELRETVKYPLIFKDIDLTSHIESL